MTNKNFNNNDQKHNDKIDDDEDFVRSKYYQQPESILIRQDNNCSKNDTLAKNFNSSINNNNDNINTDTISNNNEALLDLQEGKYDDDDDDDDENDSSFFTGSNSSMSINSSTFDDDDVMCYNNNQNNYTKDNHKSSTSEGKDAIMDKKNDNINNAVGTTGSNEIYIKIAKELSQSDFFPSVLSILVEKENNKDSTGGLTASQILHTIKPLRHFLQEQSNINTTTIIAQTNIHFISPIQVLKHCPGITYNTLNNGQIVHFYKTNSDIPSNIITHNVNSNNTNNNYNITITTGNVNSQKQQQEQSTLTTNTTPVVSSTTTTTTMATSNSNIEEVQKEQQQEEEEIIAASIECLRLLYNYNTNSLPRTLNDFIVLMKRFINIETTDHQKAITNSQLLSLWLKLFKNKDNDDAINTIYTQLLKWDIIFITSSSTITTTVNTHQSGNIGQNNELIMLQWKRNRMQTIINQYPYSTLQNWYNKKGEMLYKQQQQQQRGSSNEQNEEQQDLTNNKKRKFCMVEASRQLDEDQNDQLQQEQQKKKSNSISTKDVFDIDFLATQECLRILRKVYKDNNFPNNKRKLKKFLRQEESKKTCFRHWLLYGQSSDANNNISIRRKEAVRRLLDVLHKYNCVKVDDHKKRNNNYNWCPNYIDQVLLSSSSSSISLQDLYIRGKNKMSSKKQFDDKQGDVLYYPNHNYNTRSKKNAPHQELPVQKLTAQELSKQDLPVQGTTRIRRTTEKSDSRSADFHRLSGDNNIDFLAAQECLHILKYYNYFPSSKMEFNKFLRHEEKQASCCFGYWLIYGQGKYNNNTKTGERRRHRHASRRLLTILRQYQCVGRSSHIYARNDDFEWYHDCISQVLHTQYNSIPACSNQFESLQEWYKHNQRRYGHY